MTLQARKEAIADKHRADRQLHQSQVDREELLSQQPDDIPDAGGLQQMQDQIQDLQTQIRTKQKEVIVSSKLAASVCCVQGDKCLKHAR